MSRLTPCFLAIFGGKKIAIFLLLVFWSSNFQNYLFYMLLLDGPSYVTFAVTDL